MARDGVFPYSSYLRRVYQKTKTPLINIIFVFVLDALFVLSQLFSTGLFLCLVAIGTVGLQISYLMPILFRCTVARKTFPEGEFSLGVFGIPVAIISSIWLTLTSIVMFLPMRYPITIDNMNYTIVAFTAVFILAGSYWFFAARHWFVGPRRTDYTIPLLPAGSVHNEDKLTKESMLVE